MVAFDAVYLLAACIVAECQGFCVFCDVLVEGNVDSLVPLALLHDAVKVIDDNLS